jgi:hypothetical protein
MTFVAGSRVIRAGMVVQLATVKQERNAAILKVIEKDGVLKRSLEQLQSAYWILVLSSSSSSSSAFPDFSFPLVSQRSRPSWSSLGHLESGTRPP